ncbi:hypothetical protein B0H11DRAFT_474751 [Mycena galericulata]|nr:hypothetical protein B0H11DRAFT_474751 [Mycena galericulata]
MSFSALRWPWQGPRVVLLLGWVIMKLVPLAHATMNRLRNGNRCRCVLLCLLLTPLNCLTPQQLPGEHLVNGTLRCVFFSVLLSICFMHYS